MPFTAVLLIVGMLSISGMPFFSGYVSKSLIKYAFKENVLHMTLFNLINLGTVTSFLKFSRILFGKKIDSKELVKDKKRYISMSLLAISSVIVGILYLPVILNLFGFEAYYINLFDFSSWLNYLLYIFIGFLFYRYVIRKDFKFLQAIRNFSMSFEDANYALILYISIFVSVMFFVI